MIVFCLASTRSGTTAIARCFRETSSFVNLGEVFYDAANAKGHYVEEWEQPSHPSPERFDEYLEFLGKDTDHLYWLDIKFHDLNRFNPRQVSITAQPKLLKRLVEGGDPTVLIGRANPLRAASSEIQATSSGTFHLGRTEKIDAPPAGDGYDRRKTVAAIRDAMHRQGEFRIVEGHLRTHPNLFRVDYEALFDCPEASENREALGAWIGADVVREPDLSKVSCGWPDWFDRDLAAKILQGTTGQWWV